MNRISLYLLFSICLFTFLPGISSAKSDMKLRLNKGARHIYVISQENQAIENEKVVEVEQKIALTIDHQVINLLPNGNYSIQLAFKRFSIFMKHSQRSLRYDSDTVDVMNPLYKTLNFLTDIRLNYEVSPEGIVSNLKGFDPVKKAIEKNAQLGNFLRNFGSELFYTELYNYIPKSEVEIGEKWKTTAVLPDLNNLKCEIQYTLKEATPQNLQLAQAASFKMTTDLPAAPDGSLSKVNENGTQAGSLVIDSKTNMRISSVLTQSVNVLMTTNKTEKNPEKSKTLKLITQTTFALVKK
jgi:hypothetical protein